MKVYLAIKFYEDCENRDFIEKISYALEENGIAMVSMTRDFEKWGQVRFSPEELMIKSFEQIDLCDLVLVELSEKGVGIGIEAGYAYAKDIPIISIAKSGCDISSTLQGISKGTCNYNGIDDLKELFGNILK